MDRRLFLAPLLLAELIACTQAPPAPAAADAPHAVVFFTADSQGNRVNWPEWASYMV